MRCDPRTNEDLRQGTAAAAGCGRRRGRDGKPGAEDRLNTDRSGCNADFRYYEGADNFDVAKSISYAKITLKGRTLTVKIDPRADGKFQDW